MDEEIKDPKMNYGNEIRNKGKKKENRKTPIILLLKLFSQL
jgi:hypothetical protein